MPILTTLADLLVDRFGQSPNELLYRDDSGFPAILSDHRQLPLKPA